VDALSALQNTAYAMLITDCHMPNLNGYDLTRRIRERETSEGRAPLPIIGITASTGTTEAQRCLEAGMDTTLFKPVQLQGLRECLERYAGTGGKPAA
jgi:CheY-like chemotaxis protein